MSELKPCPACGGTDLIIYGKGSEKHYVRCHGCDMQGPEIYGRDKAAAAWNALHRTPEWTSEPPTQPGWYFTRRNSPGYPVRVTYVKQEERYSRKLKKDAMYFTMAQTEDDDGYVIDDLNQDERQWAGPITNPKDAK